MRSSTVTPIPMVRKSAIMVVISLRWGILVSKMGLSASKVAARIGNAAFLEPEMRISPLNGPPPMIINLSIKDSFEEENCLAAARRMIGLLLLLLLPLFRGEGLHIVHRMNTAISELAGECGVNQLLLFDNGKAGEGRTNYYQGNVIALHTDLYLTIRNSALN